MDVLLAAMTARIANLAVGAYSRGNNALVLRWIVARHKAGATCVSYVVYIHPYILGVSSEWYTRAYHASCTYKLLSGRDETDDSLRRFHRNEMQKVTDSIRREYASRSF